MFSKLKWQVVIVTVTLVLGVLLGGFNLYQNRILPQKIATDIKSFNGVQSADVTIGNSGYTANVKLKKVDNLMSAYKDIEKIVEKYPAKIDIKIVDNPNEKLDNLFYEDQFAIYQAIQNGDYIEMSNIIDKNSIEKGAKTNLYIDENNIYLSIYDGQNYLYKIIPRNTKGDVTDG
ncbi:MULTISPECIES: hypothetical protein [Thermoanaerobacterium]|uniref:Uncharacterized protein n=2 Tax=Thermoanaerobacterium TaxID=28895 RepID=W9EAE8_9THEO|nr:MULTISPECIES: hypothetical protein [Thermoanaerobacterium]AFK85696.1 hypothetical protein Tsac_0672 [Thermoanaerobacterium saccharolyticum JW/SL-YS485]ETO37890.1 hypothetical protein V518_1963 [Thermoanaerobacterium aotearoense SCUT27]